MDKEMINILCCPESKQEVSLAEKSLIDSINQKIERKEIKNRAGEIVAEKIDKGLIRVDKKYLYPVRDDIPVMLIDEAIPL